MKKIAVLNDLSGMGKCSLTAAIPVISVMGIQVCPLPTAILSSQTGFPSYYCDNYTDHMHEIMGEWQKLGFRPDGIYTGFLADTVQVDKAIEFIDLFSSSDTRILVDPVMGDEGEKYPIYTEALCQKMRMLVRKATLITPNMTEALLLLYDGETAYNIWKKSFSLYEKQQFQALRSLAEDIGKQLVRRFHTEAVITGIHLHSEHGIQIMGNLICSEEKQLWVTAEKIGGSYSGTGDLFASVLSAGMLKNWSTEVSVKKAVSFLTKGIRDAVREGSDRNEGICFERYLYELSDVETRGKTNDHNRNDESCSR